jgi:hypothetical protein
MRRPAPTPRGVHEAGMLKTSPKKLIAEAADWRFLRELKVELKG